MDKINKFSLATVCPKCNHDQAKLEYCVVQHFSQVHDPHLDVICLTCGYTWYMACADTPTTKPRQQ